MLTLVKPLEIYESEFIAFINEFKIAKENLVSYSIDQKEMNFQVYVKSLHDESLGKGISKNWVPASTYFLMNKDKKIFGAVNKT
ncbi:MAG: hypothetical protein K8S23_04230 [Candidatus Cloacimonetes bacterium]|nr:hypothetical protein [Candidatus Cloacimonadota bacterium]